MRRYEGTHPWITFQATRANDVLPRHWMLVGEAKSKCQHLAGTPLKPEVASELYTVTLVKGALATTAIEGNTLTEDQVMGILRGTYKAPPSRQYQEREVRNLLEALDGLQARIVAGEGIPITKALICEFDRLVLRATVDDPAVVPGEIRTHSVVVGSYRGAPAEDCDYLLDRLADWLEGPTFHSDDPEIQFALTLAKAVYAHLYLAWIHPLADGNGRTARLVEFAILASSGLVPVPAAHLLSNHYNLTRDRYYRELSRASEARDALGFLAYAIEGFVDGIREVIDMVRRQQVQIAWINYVHEVFHDEANSKANDRQRDLVLALPMWDAVRRADLSGLSPKLAWLYATAGPRTMSRDLNHLQSLGLIARAGSMVRARADKILAFRPPMGAPETTHEGGREPARPDAAVRSP